MRSLDGHALSSKLWNRQGRAAMRDDLRTCPTWSGTGVPTPRAQTPASIPRRRPDYHRCRHRAPSPLRADDGGDRPRLWGAPAPPCRDTWIPPARSDLIRDVIAALRRAALRTRWRLALPPASARPSTTGAGRHAGAVLRVVRRPALQHLHRPSCSTSRSVRRRVPAGLLQAGGGRDAWWPEHGRKARDYGAAFGACRQYRFAAVEWPIGVPTRRFRSPPEGGLRGRVRMLRPAQRRHGARRGRFRRH